ncbi:hypothetical protein DSTSK_24820 [Desulforhabdus sp. TSK]|nr:hypothetical protein DSTSK_24820 [Desulforhabdus sp. TSK]
MTLREILSDIHALEEDLLDFERKYGVRSETFYAAYVIGEEPEDDTWMLDFGEWASITAHGSPGRPNTGMKSSGSKGKDRALQD